MRKQKCRTIGCEEYFETYTLGDYCDNCLDRIRFPKARQLVDPVEHIDVEAPSMGFIDRLQEDENTKHAHYFRDVTRLKKVDVYRIIDLFGVTDGALQHIAKKALCAGDRGHKDFRQDLEDILDSIERRLEMLDEDETDA